MSQRNGRRVCFGAEWLWWLKQACLYPRVSPSHRKVISPLWWEREGFSTPLHLPCAGVFSSLFPISFSFHPPLWHNEKWIWTFDVDIQGWPNSVGPDIISWLAFSLHLLSSDTPLYTCTNCTCVNQYTSVISDDRNQNCVSVLTVIILPPHLRSGRCLSSHFCHFSYQIWFSIQSQPRLPLFLSFLYVITSPIWFYIPKISWPSVFEVHYFLLSMWPFFILNDSMNLLLSLWTFGHIHPGYPTRLQERWFVVWTWSCWLHGFEVLYQLSTSNKSMARLHKRK